MAKKEFSRFVTPETETRAAEAAKTTRLRALRLAKEAEERTAVEQEAAAKLAKAQSTRRVRAPQPVTPT